MNLIVTILMCFISFSGSLLAGDVPAELKNEIDNSDFVVLSAHQGRSLFGIKGLGGENVLDKDKILVLRLTGKQEEPCLVIKKKDSPRFDQYYVKDGSIKVNGHRVKINDLLESMKIPVGLVAPVLIGEKP